MIADGMTIRELCKADDMPAKSTVFLWLANHKEFSDQYARAKEAQADDMAEELLEISDNGANDWMERNRGEERGWVANGEHIQRSRLRVDARKWLMSKMAPKKYGDKVEHSGNLGFQVKPLSEVDDKL
jgi:hypothetical protein